MRFANRDGLPFIPRHLTWGAACVLLTLSTCALAQTAVPIKASSSAAEAKSPKPVQGLSKPSWQELTPVQQTSLKPLAANWNTLSESQKRKWLAIALNYPKLAPQEQVKMHSRMTEWVSLSQQQRSQARLNFAQSKALTPSQKAANWKAYQELSPEEKQKLASSAAPKSAGAATAAKPVSPQKLAVVPVNRKTTKAEPKMAVASQTLDRNTLLPQTPSTTESGTSGKN